MNKLKSLWNKLPDGVRRVIHTFIQVAGGILLQQLLAAHSAADVKAAVTLSGAGGLAAVKALIIASL